MHLGVVVKSSAVMRGDIKNSTVAGRISTVLGLGAVLVQKGLAGRRWGRGRKTCIIMPSLLAKEKRCKAEVMASCSFFGRSQAGDAICSMRPLHRSQRVARNSDQEIQEGPR